MRGMPWLRLYTEFATDHKVQMMSEAMQRRLIMLFCLQGEGILNDMSEDDICYRLRISKSEWRKTRNEFMRRGFINGDDSTANGDDFLRNFAARQFQSDTSKERMRKHREKMRHINKDGGNCDVTVTSHETFQKRHSDSLDTEADTEQKQNRTDTEIINSSSNNSAGAILLPPPIAAPAADLPEDLKNRISDRQIYLDCLLPAFPTGGAQVFCNDVVSKMLNDWHGRGVSAEDIEPVVSRVVERGQKVSSPKYFDGAVLENCARRKKSAEQEKVKSKYDPALTKAEIALKEELEKEYELIEKGGMQ